MKSYVHWTLAALLGLGSAQACGPDFTPDVFVRTDFPDAPKQFVAGKLGLLQPGVARADLLVAYRYLSGGSLDAAEQQGWQPEFQQISMTGSPDVWEGPYAQGVNKPDPTTPLGRWMLERASYPDVPLGPVGEFRNVHTAVDSQLAYEASYFNCGHDAFRTAALTLADRASRWGKTSPYLLDWLHGQDAVFANCVTGDTQPGPPPSGAPPLLVSDRAYQVAAAHFYAQQLEPARAGFLAISNDKASPWQPIAGYLVARVLIREAFLSKPDPETQATSDPVRMQAAARQLQSYLAAAPPPALRKAAEAELAMVRLRIEPDQRARELAALVGSTAHDPNYVQDLEDLLWLIDKKTPEGLRAQPEPYEQVTDSSGQTRQATQAEAVGATAEKWHTAYEGSAAVRALAPIIDWTLTYESLDPVAAAHALSEWKRTHQLPWLVAALALAPDSAPSTELTGLIDAAAAVPEGSPAWRTVTYHRARLLLASRHPADARVVLATALPRVPQTDQSDRNAFRGLALRAAPSLSDFLEYAPRTIVAVQSEESSAMDECATVMMNQPKRHYNCLVKSSSTQIDADAAGVLNKQAPLSTWLAAAQSPSLSAELRQAIAQGGWVRAVLLEDQATAAEFLPLLPTELQKQADQPGFAQWAALARNPGLVPFVNAGAQRAYSWDFVESYRDNWCYRQPQTGSGPESAFLTPEEKIEGARQATALDPLAADVLGERILDAVRAHPEEPRNAEALYLILRMVRYGCVDPQAPQAPSSPPGAAAGNPQNFAVVTNPSNESMHLYRLRQEASRILRQRYATSPWTKRAAPFAG